MELNAGPSDDNVAAPMFYDADLEQFDHEEEPLKVSPYMLKSFQFVKDKATGYYSCEFCTYRSMHRSSIKSHLAVHSSARPFACGMCEYEAKRVNDLRKHWLIKHGKRLATRSRGYRPRATPNNSMTALSSTDNTNRGLETNLTQNDASQLRVLHDKVSKWSHNSNALSAIAVYPEPEVCLENAAITSPHSEFNDVDMELVDAEEDDINSSDTFGSFTRSGDDELVIVKTEPTHDEYYPSVSKAVNEGDNRADDKMVENSLKCGQPVIEKSRVNHNQFVSSSLRSSQSPVTSRCNSQSTPLVQTTNSSNVSVTPQQFVGESRVGRNHGEPLNIAVGDIKSANQMNPHLCGSDSSNSTTVTSSASHLRHACVGTSRGWMCSFCNIQFFDNAIYFIHMGLHDRRDPWKCTVCGTKLYDVYSFTSHFVNGHSSS